jgi:exodeoxyribonuclease VII large subunit
MEIDAKLQEGRERLALAAASLDALSPLGVLQRGYAIAQDADGKLVRDAAAVKIGDAVSVRLAKGRLGTRIERIEVTD